MAPSRAPRQHKISLFLAGSIEMGTAEEWQRRVVEKLDRLNIDIFNPRRLDWDHSIIQSIKNPYFYEQVMWEMDKLEEADIILYYFDPKAKSPITLMELGLHAQDSQVVVVCPDGFWRKGNVEVVCHRNMIPLFNNLDGGLASVRLLYELQSQSMDE